MISKNQSLALFLIICIFLASGFLYILNISHAIKEGFDANTSSGLQTNYNALQSNLKMTLRPYCSLSEFIQDQMKTMYKTTKISESGESIPGDTDAQAMANIKTAYEDAYACKDELASSRPTCVGPNASIQSNVKMEFIPCSVYINTPTYDDSDPITAAVALSQIPDNLALRITKEVDWYSAIIKKLQSGIDAGANPPGALPSDAPGADYKAPPDKSAPLGAAKKEGFFDGGSSGKCSPEAMKKRQEKRRQKMLDEESANCTSPDLQTEIDRVNKILNSDTLKSALANCAEVAAAGKKLQSQLALLKSGNLYAWQKSGPKKSYAQFKGGDRVAGLTFSLQQNRG